MSHKTYFLESGNAEKVGNVYTFDFKEPHNNKTQQFQLKSATVAYHPTVNQTTTTQDILDLGVSYMVDLDNTVQINPSSISEGDDIVSYVDPSGSGYTPASGSGTGHKWVLSDSAYAHFISSEVAWHTFVGTCTVPETNKSTLGFLFRQSSGNHIIFTSARYGDVYSNGNQIWIHNGSQAITNSINVPDADCAVVIVANADQYDWWLQNLDDDSEQTATSTITGLSSSSSYTVGAARANTGFITKKVGSWACVPDKSNTTIQKMKDWLVQKYTNVGIPVAGPRPLQIRLCSRFLSQAKYNKSQEKPNETSACITSLNYVKEVNDKAFYKLEVVDTWRVNSARDFNKFDIFFTDGSGSVCAVDSFSVVLDLVQI